MNDPATFEAVLRRDVLRSNDREPPRNRAEVSDCLDAIEAEASKWLGGRHSLITRHVATLRKLLA